MEGMEPMEGRTREAREVTGQEKQEDREKVIANPPDILLTNYMMLELLMVRKADEALRNSFLDNIQFLVYDELHVYKGRQGADVSLLNRRIKSAAKNKNINKNISSKFFTDK